MQRVVLFYRCGSRIVFTGCRRAQPNGAPALGKGVAAAADFADNFGGAAGVAAQAVANVTAVTADVSIGLTTGGMATLREARYGVDVHQVSIVSERGVVVIDDPEKAAFFVASPEGTRWVNAPGDLRIELADILRSIAPRAAFASLTRERFNGSRSFVSTQAEMQLLPDGFVGFRWDAVSATYALR